MIPVRTVQDLLASVWVQPWVRLLTYLLLAAAALWFIRRLGSVLMTAAVAYGLAYLVNPALTWLEGRGVRRVVGVLLVTLIGLMVLSRLCCLNRNASKLRRWGGVLTVSK